MLVDADRGRLVEVVVEGQERQVVSPAGEMGAYEEVPEHEHAPGLGEALPVYLALPPLLRQ